MTGELLDTTNRRCAVCGRDDLPSYAFVHGISACCFECLTGLVAAEISRIQQTDERTNRP